MHLHAASDDENKAVTSACLNRMPGPIVQAPPGGTSPRTINNLHVSNHHQHTERLEIIREEGAKQESQDEQSLEGQAVWVQGSMEEDKKRYRDLMAYMEEKRVEAKEQLKEEKERKEIAKKKEESWTLLRMSITYLKENEEGWRIRKMKECEKIKEEEKKDRLALAREKKVWNQEDLERRKPEIEEEDRRKARDSLCKS